MPFLSRDWRCPGDKWIKSVDSGSSWENARNWRQKVFANMNAVALRRIYRQSLTDDSLSTSEFDALISNIVCFQPHIHLQMNVTREIPITSTITDALLNLDMKSAINDIRRFNYVCKLVKHLLCYKFHTLSGRSQMYIIELLKVIMNQVMGSCNQTLEFRQLLESLKTSLEKNTYQHMGSSQLWNSHWNALTTMSSTLDKFDISEPSSSPHPRRPLQIPASVVPKSSSASPADHLSSDVTVKKFSLETLPPECLARILANVHSPEDLEAASIASPALAFLINDHVLWRHLTVQNFTPNQIMSVQYGRTSWKDDQTEQLLNECNWRRAYIRLLRRYGEQQVHSSSLGICELCYCLFWMLLGHPCSKVGQPPKVRALSPMDFVNLFET